MEADTPPCCHPTPGASPAVPHVQMQVSASRRLAGRLIVDAAALESLEHGVLLSALLQPPGRRRGVRGAAVEFRCGMGFDVARRGGGEP